MRILEKAVYVGPSLYAHFPVIRLEIDYIREWTLWKDLGILLKTIPAVLYMRGAG